jgi:hypothetical protein
MKNSLFGFLILAPVICFATTPARADETARLRALLADEWEYTVEQSPVWASELGDRRWNDRWAIAGTISVWRTGSGSKRTPGIFSSGSMGSSGHNFRQPNA